MPGPEYYNNWVRERPITTNQTYGFFMRGEMAARRANMEAARLTQSQECNGVSGKRGPCSSLSALYASASQRPRFTHSRPVNYFVADPLPKDYSRTARPITAGQSVYLWNTLSGCTVKANM